MKEPILTDEDRRVWEQWRALCLLHAQTRQHQRMVERARGVVADMQRVAPQAYVACSGGKDSTAMVHLVAECGVKARVMSVKDDLDYPGEEEFVRRLCSRVGLDVDILHPPFSLQQWIVDHAADLVADEDMHSRSAEFSKAAFYDVIEGYRKASGTPGVYLGLRKHESYGRLLNRVTHGALYQKKETGEWVATPLADWTGRDVFAFLFARSAEILPVYSCCARLEPERIRKSWWIPGSHSRHGGMVWLRTYYPSLFQRLKTWLPEASRTA